MITIENCYAHNYSTYFIISPKIFMKFIIMLKIFLSNILWFYNHCIDSYSKKVQIKDFFRLLKKQVKW